jgi:hypothetical protein
MLFKIIRIRDDYRSKLINRSSLLLPLPSRGGDVHAALRRQVVRHGMQRRGTDPTREGAVVPVYGGAAREEAGQRPPALDLGPFGLIWAYGWLS